MHPRAPRRTGTLASAIVLTLLAVPSAAVAAPDPGPGPAPGVPRSGPAAQARAGVVDPADKITPAATKAFRARGATDFWLRFADEPDLTAAKAITSWSERGEYVYDTLVATAEASQEQAIAVLEESGTEYTSYWATNAILVEGGSLDQAVDLAADAQVLEVRPTTHYEAPEPVETDVVESEAKAVAADVPTPTWGVAAINADDLWAQGITGEGVVVAGIDSGVDLAIDSVGAQYRGAESGHNYNWHDAAGLGYRSPQDAAANGHGTHTMGTMIGGTVSWNQVQHQFGVAPGAQWIATNGCAARCLDEALIRSGEWILAPTRVDGTVPDPAMRPHVVNNSWGSKVPSTDPFVEDIVTAWEAAGIFATFSNGNFGKDGCQSSSSPGSRQASYSVGAFRQSGAIAPFSARGSGQDGAVKPDVVAPGERIFSSLPGGHMGYLDGTSMAAPHVAGAVALLWDAVPELLGDVTATRAILDESAVDVRDVSCGGTTDDNNVWGEGKLDVLAAYELTQDRAFVTAPEPVISGAEVKVGVQLTATVPVWSPTASFTYQWRRDGAKILGATNATYTPRGADAGAQLSVTVLGKASGRTPTARTSVPTAVVAPGVMTASDPIISPTAKVGTTLYARSGTWTSGTRFTYKWLANGTPISGATAFTFVPTSAHRGKQLTVTITGKRAGYVSETRTSSAVTVGYGVFSTRYPRIIGNTTPGQTVKASTPQWVPARSTTTYTWKIDGKVISGATASSFRVPSNYAAGRVLTVAVKGQRAGYTTKSLESIGYKVGKPFTKRPYPKLSGSARVGSRLTMSPGTWSPKAATLSYRWYASGKPISGVTGRTYTLKGSDYGKEIVATVTARKPGYATTSRTSSPTAAVGKPFATIPANGGFLVGSDSVPAGTYVAAAGSRFCSWKRAPGRPSGVRTSATASASLP